MRRTIHKYNNAIYEVYKKETFWGFFSRYVFSHYVEKMTGNTATPCGWYNGVQNFEFTNHNGHKTTCF